jgi:hypothetical protein
MVSNNFLDPVGLARLGHAPEPTFVAVPKTAVNKNDLPQFWEDEIRLSGQARAVASESVSVRTNNAANQ